MAMFSSNDIAADSVLAIDGAELWLFGFLQSSMYMAWVRTVCGRLKSDLRMSPDIAYNAFPFPELTDSAEGRIADAIDQVLSTRSLFPGSSLADLYDPLAMPESLVRAHDELDRVVASAYGTRRRLASDADRLSLLFERYEQSTAPLLAAASTRTHRSR